MNSYECVRERTGNVHGARDKCRVAQSTKPKEWQALVVKKLWHVRILCPGSKLPLFLLNGKFGRFRFRDEFVRHALFDDVRLRLHNVELRFDGRFLMPNSRNDFILYYQLGVYSVIDLSIHPTTGACMHVLI